MKLILCFVLCFAYLNAKLLNYTLATVNNQIITAYDANTLAKRLKITQAQALDVLIDDHIKDLEIAKLGLGVPQAELDESAQKLGLSTQAQIKGLRDKMNEQRFFTFILDNARINADPVILRNYYESNKRLFASFAKIKLVLYTSENEDLISKVKHNLLFKSPKLTKKVLNLTTADLNPDLLALLNRTKAGTFTRTFSTQDGYLAYYIKAKTGEEKLNYEQVKTRVREAFMAKQERLYLQNYLNKLKASAQIVLTPKPAQYLDQN